VAENYQLMSSIYSAKIILSGIEENVKSVKSFQLEKDNTKTALKRGSGASYMKESAELLGLLNRR